ncbi:hypothetical protein BG46_25200 [Brucella anthropi]|uniref:hypothetical protein n=1 Tax=Brucella anthropi TaxID=529 RepID=UPI00044A99D0|nr:hypothetical protein [Brucella anthropi]EXL04376.1 hypothetical protein BG46_25200 [Brucella anthropi]
MSNNVNTAELNEVLKAVTTVGSTSSFLSVKQDEINALIAGQHSLTRIILATLVHSVKVGIASDVYTLELARLAKQRKVTLKWKKDENGHIVSDGSQRNVWLSFTRLFIGRSNNNGDWVPDAHAASNLPNALRELASYEETSVEGLLDAIENATTVKGKKTLTGVNALRQADRSKHGTPRKTSMTVDQVAEMPMGVTKVVPVASVHVSDLSLFPVDDDGYGLANIRIDAATGTVYLLFGTDGTEEVVNVTTKSYLAHKDRLKMTKLVNLTGTNTLPARKSVAGKAAA